MSSEFDFDEQLGNCGHHDNDLVIHGADMIAREIKQGTKFDDKQIAQISEVIVSLLTSLNTDGNERSKEVKASGIHLLQVLVPDVHISKYKNVLTTLLDKLKGKGEKLIKMTEIQRKSKTTEEVSIMDIYSLGLSHIIEKCDDDSRVQVTAQISTAIMNMMKKLKASPHLMQYCFDIITKLLKTDVEGKKIFPLFLVQMIEKQSIRIPEFTSTFSFNIHTHWFFSSFSHCR
jgi:hypothetical protein